MKARLGILAGLVLLLTGCVAIPPLITVHKESSGEEDRLRHRIDQLEQRIRELETARPQP